MNRELLAHLPVVLQVARQGGFAAAASSLNISPSAVSHAVRAVEQSLGEPLFARTTRSVALTEAGERFLASVGPALEAISAAAEQLTARRGDISGVVRINASRVAMRMALPPILARLALLHPHLVVEVHADDAFVDIVAGGFDAGVRLGEAVQQDMVMVRLTPAFNAILVAAPTYLERRGMPTRLAELTQHNCIGFRLLGSGSLYEWDLLVADAPVRIRTRGSVVVTDATFARELALTGIGIAYVFEPLVAADLQAGRLQRVLPTVSQPEDGLFLYFPRRAALAPKLRAFIDAARELAQNWPGVLS